VIAQQHPHIGTIETLAPVVRMSRTPAAVTLPPPSLGEHTVEVLEGLRAKG
jgi:crotonobetainyl-CoA:carnitine CoA-transferase CaiB-like acyl-CoA transferase